MSRLKNFARGVFSGYVQMAANIGFTLASVPLALHYLPKEEFALWALVAQITSYFGLIDLGMSGSVSRILADHKDDRDGGSYGGILKAGAVVFAVQGAIIAVGTMLLAPLLASAFEIDSVFRSEFIFLLQGYGILLAFGFATKIVGTPFWAFQRFDVGNYCATVGFGLQLLVLWMGFVTGCGLKSMLGAQAAWSLFSFVWSLVAGLRLGFYPQSGAWGQIERSALRELFTFGRDIFLMTIGSQLLSASQIMIVTRLLGLEAAATWAICSKLFTLAQQVVSRVFETSVGAFTEMYVRKEHDRLKRRFRDVVILTASLSVVASVVGVAINQSFVEVWTKGRVAWPIEVDFLLGLLLVVSCTSRCLTGIAGVTKELRYLRFVYFFEGLSFVILAWLGGSWFGFAGIAAASVIAMTVWSGLYGFLRTRQQWQCSSWELISWLIPAGRLVAVFVPSALLLGWWLRSQTSLGEFVILAGALSLLGLFLAWLVGLPSSLKGEITARLSS